MKNNNNRSGIEHARSEFEKIPEKFSIDYNKINLDISNEILFNVGSLHDTTFKKLLLYFADISGSPKEYILTSLLSCLSGSVGNKVYFKIKDSFVIFLDIWAVIIGTSTIMRKTTAINFVKESLQRIETSNISTFNRQLENYNRQIEFSKNEKQKADIVKPVRKYCLFPNDTTIECLSDILAVSKGGLLIHSELAGWLQQLTRSYSGDAKQFFTNIYDVPETWEVARKSVGNTTLTRPYISILGASTIEWLKDYTTASDYRSGFLSRFIFAIRNVPEGEHIPLLKLREKSVSTKNKINPRDIFNYLVEIETERELDITSEAAEIFNNYDLYSYAELLKSTNEDEMSFKGRLLIGCIKFAGLIALTEKRFVITKEDIEDAIHITEYYKRNVERLINKEIVKNENTQKEEKVLRLISNTDSGEIKRSDLSNRANLKNVKELDEIIGNLLDKEKIIAYNKKPQTGGRASTYYKVIK